MIGQEHYTSHREASFSGAVNLRDDTRKYTVTISAFHPISTRKFPSLKSLAAFSNGAVASAVPW